MNPIHGTTFSLSESTKRYMAAQRKDELMTSQEFGKELEHIARPLVEAGIYGSQEAFVRDIVKEMAVRRIRTYEKTVNRYKAKYGSLQRFGVKIRGKATPKQEDESMEWEAAEDMLKAWKRVAKSSV
jgi:Arc/MetJ-type ribon-helix-helix transcriptional regulator